MFVVRASLAVGLAAMAGAFAFPLAFTACSSPPDAPEAVGHSASALNANDETAFDFFVSKGLTGFQAAGIVGNLDQESNDDPTAVQSGGPGRGIAQWSVGGRWDTDTNDNVLWYASKEGESSTSLQLQLEFIWYELTTFSGYGLASLKASTNVTDATIAFETDFEGCGECDQSNRISYAEAALAAYGTFPYAAQFVSQSFPLATTTLTMVEGQVIPSYIELKNTGTKSWDSNTRIGTTQPRDRVSVFADSTWVSDNRPAAVKGTVAPGDTYKFTFDLAAPQTAGTFTEYFGVVEDGVAWFSDPGQGGPPDNDLEVKIPVIAPEYRGTFKGQSFPLAPTPDTVDQGTVVIGYIELTNTGTATWKSGTTKLAPIPRDQASPFADPSWLSPTRISTVAADVAPGAVGRFDVTLDANAVGDTELEFGLVEEAVTWFADPTLGGGPADGFLKVHLVVVPPGTSLDAGAVAREGGAVLPPVTDGGSSPMGHVQGPGVAPMHDSSGGCSVSETRAAGAWWPAAMGLGLAAAAIARRRASTARPPAPLETRRSEETRASPVT
jgi:tail lysozyme/Ig-like domain-containing protein